MNKETLHHQIENTLGRFIGKDNELIERPIVPAYIQKNLRHQLRPYQQAALEHLLFMEGKPSSNHLLFLMATGSGKTNVLAASVLYLYKQKGFQNFLFFVNSDSIIRKTEENLLNPKSSKYLFNPEGIEIDGERISIQVVDVFPKKKNKQTIYLKLTTIQKLHIDLTHPRENGLTYQSLAEEKLILLSDEAHHINVQTKKKIKKKETKEEIEEKNWEITVSNIMRANPENRMLEFTATLNLDNDHLFDKYKDRVLFQYDLPRFMNDGYSKNVLLAKHNEDDQSKMLKATLLNQYRKYVANENGINLKPVIMFKSNTIALSKDTKEDFMQMIQELSEPTLKKMVQREMNVHRGTSTVWEEVFNYYDRTDLLKVIRDLKNEFTQDTILVVNSQEIFSEKDAVLLNSLEDMNNPIRAIFAVAKLNEGWDVLNLFDIVRISESASTTQKATDSEAQLIGRGARYYPFEFDGEKSFQRRFDLLGRKLSVLESLHYHTMNESAYIKNLIKSLDAAGIQTKEEKYNRYEAKLKKKFKEKPLFKNGKIYINKWVKTTPDDYNSFDKYAIDTRVSYNFERTEEEQYGKRSQSNTALSELYTEVQLPLDRRIIQKAIQRNPFFSFSSLMEYTPSLVSIQDFIDSPSFMGGCQIFIRLPRGMTIDELSKKEQLTFIDKYLRYVEEKMKLNYAKEKGTPEFIGESFANYIEESYVIQTNSVNNNSKSLNTQIISSRSMRGQDWYIYDQAIGNPLEWALIEEINQFLESLEDKYQNIYLVRNERRVKFREIGGIRGFMPDFLLFMEDEKFTYQLFIEPKGSHLKAQDTWKEKFMLSLTEREDIEVLHEGKDVRLIGFKFYSDSNADKQAFREDFMEKLNIKSPIQEEFKWSY
ncbi:DEAD/DEAH box helicase family protein [Peribacillus butanolivorans]|uniref:DEAD/DEAH box helicase family protein n=1 Tax=Peribacillus butanolivorans TaxID=421767 RepID=UPI0039FD1A11